MRFHSEYYHWASNTVLTFQKHQNHVSLGTHIATHYGLDVSVFRPGWEQQIFLLNVPLTPSHPSMRLTCTMGTGVLSRGVKRPGRGGDPPPRLGKGKGVEVYIYSFFNLGARWGCAVNANPRPLYPRERPGTHCIGGWVGPRSRLDGCGKISPPPGFEPRTVQPVASRYTDWASPAHTLTVIPILSHCAFVCYGETFTLFLHMLWI